jgi:transcriptional regulator with XRE-family HTH domain
MLQAYKIRLLRVINDQTQTEAAKFLHLSQPAYDKLEKGKTPLRQHHCERLAAAYGVCPQWLAADEPFSLLVQVNEKGCITISTNIEQAAQKPDWLVQVENLFEKYLPAKPKVEKGNRKTVRQSVKKRKEVAA